MAGARATRRVATCSLDPSARPRRLQCKMRRNWTRWQQFTVPGVRAASNASAFAPSMPVYRIRNGWRVRRKMSDKTFCGPIRDIEKAANEDAQQFEEAAGVSFECLQKIDVRITCLLLASVSKHGSGWRVYISARKQKFCGPLRSLQALTEENCTNFTGLQYISTAELRNAVAKLHQQVTEAGAARDREAHFKKVALAEMRNCLVLQQPAKRQRRTRNVESEWNYSFVLASVQLLVAAYKDVKAVSGPNARQLLLERNNMLDQLSRPLGTAGFSGPVCAKPVCATYRSKEFKK